ncbi:hypothetical protein ACFL96_11045 [Thermoproteota archaeon]
MSSRDNNSSSSYEEMMRAEQLFKYMGALPESPGKLPSEAASFVTSYPLMVIDTNKFFDLLAHIYDADLEKPVYEDMMLILEKSRT